MLYDAMPSPRTRQALLIGLAFLAFVSLGLPEGVLGIAWPSVRGTFGRPLSHLGLLLAGGTAGYLASSFLGGQAIRLLGVGRVLALSAGLVAMALAGLSAAPAFGWMVLFAAVGGLGGGAIDAGINAFAASRFSPRIVNWLHASWGIGATAGPLTMTAVLAAGLSWRIGYAILGGALALLTILFVLTLRLWQSGGGAVAEAPPPPGGSIGQALRRPVVWIHVLVFFTYAGVESTAGQLLYTWFTESRGIALPTAGMAMGGFWAGLSVGRIGFGQLAARLGPGKTIRLGTVGAPMAAALIWWHPLAGAALLGLALAPIFPTLLWATPQRVGSSFAAHAVGFQISATALGYALFPTLVAVLARRWGLDMVCISLLAMSLALLVLQELAARMSPAPAAAVAEAQQAGLRNTGSLDR
jgi:fucose permease